MTPESFTKELEGILGDSLLSVALYGSAAAGERSEKYSDYNLLVVCARLGFEELSSIRPLSARWAKLGNPPPLLFTWDRLKNSSDVFPIELLDIKEKHLMLHGEDVLKHLPIILYLLLPPSTNSPQGIARTSQSACGFAEGPCARKQDQERN